MEVMEAIRNRKSIRVYKEIPVPQDKLDKLLEAARLAPSGGNRQQWKFVVVRDAEKRRILSEAANGQRQVAQAPVIIAGVSTAPDNMMICGVPGYPVDLSIALDHITLEAAAEGLGTCWIGAFSQDKSREIMGIPDNCRIVCLLTIGYPAEEGRPKSRKSLDEIVCYDTYTD